MTPERWRRVREVFDRALECDPADAERVLRDACGDDAELYEAVRRMLAETERSSPLDRNVWEPAEQHVFRKGQIVARRYRIDRYLSRGGMGEVYEAYDQELGERVALKTLLPEVATDVRMIARFKQEIQLSRRIGHPNVCRMFDLAREPSEGSGHEVVYFLTMEFLAGETLRTRLERDGRMSPAAALPLLEQMAEALDAAHRAGVIHRDFKPSNVMLVDSNEAGGGAAARAVVTDFGLARSHSIENASTATMSGQLMGTLDYMAPELLTGSPASFASDLYALGMVAFKMISGALPFASDTPFAAAILRSKQPPPSPKALVPDLEPRWERAIVRALDPEPARRFSSAADFIRALRGEAKAFTVPFAAGPWRRWAAAAGIVAAAAGLWAGWGTWARAKDRPPAAAQAFYRAGIEQIHNGAYFAATRALEQAVRAAPNYPLAHARLADAWLSLDAPERATREMVLALSGNVSALSSAERLQISAIGHLATRDYASAARDYERVVAAGESPDSYLDLGTAYLLGGRRDEAIAAYRKAAESPTPSPPAWMWLGLAYARAAKDRADVAKSEEAFQKAEEGYRLKSNLEGITSLAYHRAIASARLGDLQRSNQYLRQTMETARLVQNAYFEIEAENQLSLNASNAGDAASGEKLAHEALDLAQANQLGMLSINSFLGLATAKLRGGDFAGAEKYYRDALALAQQDNSLRWVAQAQLWLAALHDQMRQPDAVSREAGQALSYFQSQHWEQETRQALVLLGRAESAQSRYAAARDSFGQLVRVAEASHDPRTLYLAEEGLGSAFADEENYPQALVHFRNMRAASQSAEQSAYAALRCGRMLAILGEFDGAQQMFAEVEKALPKAGALRPYLALARAELSLSEGRFSEAVGEARRGLAPDQHANPATAGNLKRVLGLALLRSGSRARGRQECEEALAAIEKAGDPPALVAARIAAIEARLEAGERPGALALWKQAEPTLSAYPESAWRAFALAGRWNPEDRGRAAEALRKLQRSWPADQYGAYLNRPDIQPLARPLSAVVNAKAN